MERNSNFLNSYFSRFICNVLSAKLLHELWKAHLPIPNGLDPLATFNGSSEDFPLKL